MAKSLESTSRRKAQVPVSCYFCKGQEIKWECKDCDVRMCYSCKVTIHKGLQSAQDHDVVSIQDIIRLSLGSQEVTLAIILSVLNSFSTTLPAVHTLLRSGDNLLYFSSNIKNGNDNQLVKGKLLKPAMLILQTLKRKVCDIAINKDGEILFIEHHDNKIQMLSPVGEVKTVLDTSPMISVAIHVNKENEVAVGIREQGPPFPVKDFSVRQVIIFDSNYKRKVTLEFDKKRIKLFSYALRIRTDSRNVVYVIDRFDNDNNGRIVAVHRNGRLKFTFDGQTYLETFKPQGITITPSDNIVVSDSGSNALHVLNSNGDLLALQLVKNDLEIQSPLSLCFDAEGYLLIGCHKGKK
ncbi:protein wech-like [Mytilus edulis]|uniref:protein wech-like n=1 Tax=Mytilus edulis TaxID=6550 RepID=UPI0039EF7827